MLDFINKEPVLVLDLVKGVVVLVTLFGVPLSFEQQAGILAVALPLLSILTRQRVSPVPAEK